MFRCHWLGQCFATARRMTQIPQHPLRSKATAKIWPVIVACALPVAGVRSIAEAQEAELPPPYPSSAWTAPDVSVKPLFDAPPPAGVNNCYDNNLPPPCFDPRAQMSPYSSDDFSPRPLCDQPYNACDE